MADRLTVVQMLPDLDSGGVERGTLEVGRHLVAHGHRSIVISAGGRLVGQLVAEGSEHLAWDVGRKHPWTLHWVPRLRRLLGAERVDILHLRSRLPAWVGWLAWNGMDRASRPRLVSTVHGFYSVGRYSAVMTRGERVIAVSGAIRDYVFENYPEVDRKRVRVVPRGIDPRLFPPGYRPAETWLGRWREDFPQLDGRFVVTLPGRMTRLKGQLDFVALIAALEARGVPVHGLLVGGAAAGKEGYLGEVEAAVAESGMSERITLVGHRDDLREILAVSDAVVSLSRQPESFGRTVLEALALGVPVAGYAIGGVGEQLQASFADGLFTPGDLDAMAGRLADWSRRRPVVDPSRLPTLEAMLDGTLGVYRELVS